MIAPALLEQLARAEWARALLALQFNCCPANLVKRQRRSRNPVTPFF
jgi:hypothetical protein